MPHHVVEPPYDQFLATVETVIRERPEVDAEVAREVFLEAVTLLYHDLALDGLDEHDPESVARAYLVAAAMMQL